MLDQEIYAIICSNIRVADQRIGDVKAQAAALEVGANRLDLLLDRYGDDTVQAAIGELRERASRQMRQMIRRMPDGVWQSTAYVDSDGVINQPLVISLQVTKDDDRLIFDFTGSSPPCRGPMNSVLATTQSSVYLAMRHIFPEVPISAGAFEPLEIIRPVGTFLDAQYPRPVSGCAAEVSQRIAEAVFAALVGGGNVKGLEGEQKDLIQQRLRTLPGRRFTGSAGVQASMLASGSDDYMAHGRCTPWDHAPVDLLCRESGCHAAMVATGEPYHTGNSGPFMITANKEIWDHLAGTLWAGFAKPAA